MFSPVDSKHTDPVSPSARDGFAAGPFPLHKEFLTETAKCQFQSDVIKRLIDVVDSIPARCLKAQMGVSALRSLPSETALVRFFPDKATAAEIMVHIEPHTFVHIELATATTFNLPDDVWDSRTSDVPQFTQKIVAAVINGKLRESIFYCGSVPFRWQSTLDVDGDLVSINRIEALKGVGSLIRRRRRKDIQYDSYV